MKLETCEALVYAKLKDLKPYDKNPRKISDVKKRRLAKSLEKKGLYQPLLVWKSKMQVLGGNQRIQIIKEKVAAGEWEIDKIPITYWEGKPAEAAVIVTQDNLNDGEWDYDKLPDYLRQIRDASPDLLEQTGFDMDQLDYIIDLDADTTDFRKKIGNEVEVELDNKTENNLKLVQLKIPKEELGDWELAVIEAKKNGAKTAWDVVRTILDNRLPTSLEVKAES
jgi:hypothetical protein